MLQFICRYHHVDLRDSIGLGHARLIADQCRSPSPRPLAAPPAGLSRARHCDHLATRRKSGAHGQHHRYLIRRRSLERQWDEDPDQSLDRGGDLLRALHRSCDILVARGDGMQLLKDHFAHYRPLAAAITRSAAAGVHDQYSGTTNTAAAPEPSPALAATSS